MPTPLEAMPSSPHLCSHQIRRHWLARLKSFVPFGLGQTKPKHFRDMAAVAWRNRDNLPYAWKILSRGNLQVYWPEGNVIIRRGVIEPGSRMPDYNTRLTVEKIS